MRADSPPGAYADPASPRVALHALPEQTSAVQAAASRIKDLLDVRMLITQDAARQWQRPTQSCCGSRTNITHGLQQLSTAPL